MDVLHAVDSYLPRSGGIELHVRDLADRQRGAGIGARVVTATPADDRPGADADWVWRVPTFGGSGLVDRRVANNVDRLLERMKPDAVHAHVSMVSPFAIGVAREAARQGVPTVITVHSLWNYPTAGRLACSSLGLAGLPVRWSAVSTAAAERVYRALGSTVPVAVVPNAVEPADWYVPPNGVRAASVDGGDPTAAGFTIVSVMRLARRKRPLALARMLRTVGASLPPDAGLRAVIIGDGPQRRALERYLSRHHLDGWITLAGHLDRAAIRDQFARSSLYVAPAELESFGIAALEARCAGLPVVASRRGGVGEFVLDGVDGVLADDDDGMTRAMIRFATDEIYRRRLTDRARAAVPDLGWQAAVARSMDLYAGAGCAIAGEASRVLVPHPGVAGTGVAGSELAG